MINDLNPQIKKTNPRNPSENRISIVRANSECRDRRRREERKTSFFANELDVSVKLLLMNRVFSILGIFGLQE